MTEQRAGANDIDASGRGTSVLRIDCDQEGT